MTDWARTDWRTRADALPPPVQTAAVFAAVALLAALVPNGLVEGAVDAVHLPDLLPLTAPPIGLPGRLGLSVGAGLAAALAFAVARWLLEGRAMAAAAGPALGDDPLAVRPLAAVRDLGPRFDEMPYLRADDMGAPAPPTPDARIDPGSTMGDPRWTVPGSSIGPAPGPSSTPLIEQDDDWDRDAPQPGSAWEGPPPALPDAPGPGNAAKQWDGPATSDAPPGAVDDVDASAPSAEPTAIRVSPAIEEFLVAELARLEGAIDDGDVDDLPPTEELLARLTRASARWPGRAAPPPPAMAGRAADHLDRHIAILREPARSRAAR